MPNSLHNIQNKPFLNWEYDAVNNWLYLNWIGFVSPENIKKGALDVLEVIKVNNYQFLLNDNRQLLGPWDKANDWLQTYWIPQVAEAGLRYFAHVLAPNVAGALSAQDFHQRVDGKFNMQLFGNVEKAQNWLREKQKETDQHTF